MDEQRTTRDDLWNRLSDHGAIIGEIRSDQAATNARLGALESAVESGFRSLGTELRSMAEAVHQPDDPPNYMALIMAVLAVLSLFGGYAFLITAPMQRSIERTELHERELRLRINDIENQESRDLVETRERIAAAEARAQILKEEVRRIDDFGSRAWISRERP